MSRNLVVGTVSIVAAVAGLFGALALLNQPDPHVLSAQDQMNADNANKILSDPNVRTFALPVDEPAELEYLTTVRTTASAFELAFQHHGVFFVLCDGDNDPESACNEDSARVLRTEQVDGRTVRIAQIDMVKAGDGGKVAALAPSENDEKTALEFWRTAELTRGGTPAWVSALAQGRIDNGDEDE